MRDARKEHKSGYWSLVIRQRGKHEPLRHRDTDENKVKGKSRNSLAIMGILAMVKLFADSLAVDLGVSMPQP